MRIYAIETEVAMFELCYYLLSAFI